MLLVLQWGLPAFNTIIVLNAPHRPPPPPKKKMLCVCVCVGGGGGVDDRNQDLFKRCVHHHIARSLSREVWNLEVQ